MKASVLLSCETSSQPFLAAFYKGLHNQIKAVYEVIICVDKNDTQLVEAIRTTFQDAPFDVKFSWNTHRYNYQKYINAMQLATGDYVLFADVKHPFTEKKVEQFSRYLNDDPYIRLAFTNIEVIDGTNQIIILDYFGLTGFYERWDYFKPLANIMVKQIGFVRDFQMGITSKTVQRFLKFIAENDFQFDMDFEDFLSTYIAILYPDTIKEIPYVLNQYRLKAEEIEALQIEKRNLNYTPQQQVNWLNNYTKLVTVLDASHSVLGYTKLANQFHQKRLQKHETNNFSFFFALGNYITRSYHKYSFEPLNLFQKDRGK